MASRLVPPGRSRGIMCTACGSAPAPKQASTLQCSPVAKLSTGGLRTAVGLELVTWLILPVVICLSQRLSHACLSISNYTAKLRMAHYISYSLLDSAFTTWITVVILELIHAEYPDFGRGVFIRYKTNALRGSMVIHDNFSNRTALRRRWFNQVSSLSTFDVWVLAKHGCNG